MTALDGVITFMVLFGLFLIGYLKYMNQTFGDLFREIRDLIRESSENTVEGGIIRQ